MAPMISLVALSLIAGASALQIPINIEPLGILPAQGPIIDVKKDLVSSKALQSKISSDNLLKRAEDLFEIAKLGFDEYNHETRVIGSKGHLATIEYIYSQIAELGDYYTISNQTFGAVTGNIFEYKLIIGDDVIKDAYPMALTPATPNKEPVFGNLVLIENDGCEAEDYPESVAGAIAFIRRGTCAFGDKSSHAGRAGALAAIVYNNQQGGVGGTLSKPDPDHVATFSLSLEAASRYISQLHDGKTVSSIAYIDAIVSDIQTTNIVAQTKGGDPDNCVMLGGHSDSVAEGPGINDDGSGSLTLLEVATQLTKFSVNNCVRFAWWAGEEEGLLGSDYYVDELSEEENLKIRLFMDYDMLASPNFAYQVYDARNAINPKGSEELRNLYTDFYSAHGLNYSYIPFDGRSDYDAFIRNGIPGGGIATGAEGIKTVEEESMFGGKAGEWFDPCYHQLCDTVANLNLTAWEINTKLVAHSVATYAVSFDGFPKRTGVKSQAVKTQEMDFKYHGPKLYI